MKYKFEEKPKMNSSLKVNEKGNMYNQVPQEFRKYLIRADKEDLNEEHIHKTNMNKKIKIKIFEKESSSSEISKSNSVPNKSKLHISKDANNSRSEVNNKESNEFNTNLDNLFYEYRSFISEKNIMNNSNKNNFDGFKSYYESYNNDLKSNKMVFENLSYIENMILNKSSNNKEEKEIIQQVIL